METGVFAAVLLVIALGTLTRATFGFGDALVAMPILVVIIDPVAAAALVSLVAVVAALAIVILDWKHVHWKAALLLIAAGAVGIPIGSYVLAEAATWIIEVGLAILLLAFAIFKLSGRWQFRLKSDRWSLLFGCIAGMLGGSCNIPGPPLVVYATLRQWPADRFRGTVQAFAFPTGVLVALNHYAYGRITPEIWRCFLYALPCMFVALFLGTMLNRLVRDRGFDHFVYFLLILLGVALLLKQTVPSTAAGQGPAQLEWTRPVFAAISDESRAAHEISHGSGAVCPVGGDLPAGRRPGISITHSSDRATHAAAATSHVYAARRFRNPAVCLGPGHSQALESCL